MAPVVTRPHSRFLRWQRLHPRLARLIPRRLWARLVWREIDRMPGFRAEIRQANADFAAGRFYTLDQATGDTHPNPDWPADGPQPTHR